MLSMKAKYALRALIVLATQKKMMQSKLIAKSADVPAKFLEAILSELKHNGIVDSKRGIFGGYFLNRPANKVMIGEIVRALDGTLAPLPCASISSYRKCDDCVDEEACVVRKVMVDVRNAISNVLDGQSLADMVNLSADKKVFW